jgi:homoserine dehydrogenase
LRRFFPVWYNRSSVALNSFQTSGNSPGERDTRCRVGILGFGTVGSTVARRLTGPDSIPQLKLTHIADRRARDKRGRQSEPLASVTWTERFDDLLASDVDIVIETVSAGEPAVDYIRAALLAGKSVVTASKQVMAHQGHALLTLAERQGRQLRYEAAVGGAMPIVRVLGYGLSGDRVDGLSAILNATSNAVLSRMESEGCDIDEAIASACASGYAEVDPSLDLDGSDAAAKLVVLCALAFRLRVDPDAVETRTTARIGQDTFKRAHLRGGTIRQIAHASFDPLQSVLTAWVAPIFVANDSLFARMTGPQNAAVISCAYAGDVTLSGQGAGGDAPAVAILGDVLEIARDRAAIVPAPSLVEPREIRGLSEHSFAEAV